MQHSHHKILRNATIVSFMTGISRIAGLVRELIMAYYFGTSAVQSAFVVAFRLPNLFRRLFGEGALTNAFIPVFTETLLKEGKEAAAVFASRVMALQSTVIGLIVAVLMVGTWAVEPLFESGSRWLIIFPLMRIMLPYALLICQVAIVSAMLNTQGRFAVSSLTPVILNLTWIVALVICPLVSDVPLVRIQFISWAILAAGFIQMAFQIPTLRTCGLRFGLDFSISAWKSSPRIRTVLVLLAPTALGAGIDQINICIDGYLAYYAAPWAPAAMEYADRIAYLPLGMFSTAFMTVLVPAYSHFAALRDYDSLRQAMEKTLRNLAVITAPAMAVMFFMAAPIVELIYVWPNGKFNAESARFTTLAVMAYAPGMFTFSFQKCLTPAFFALQDTRTPVRIGLVCIGLNFTLNILSIVFLPEGYRHVGLVGSTVFCSLVNGLQASIILRRRLNLPSFAAFLPTVAKAFLCSLPMVGVCLWAHRAIPADGKLFQLLAMGAAGAAGMAVYGGLMAVFAKRDLFELVDSFRSRKKQK